MSQPVNRSPATGLIFTMSFSRIPDVTYFLQESGIPGLGFDSLPEQSTRYKQIPRVGDKLTYEDLDMTFLVNEDLSSWISMHDWLVGLGAPETARQYARELTSTPPDSTPIKGDPAKDASLFVYNSDNIAKLKVDFEGLIPYRLSKIRYSVTDNDIQYLVATVSFKYTIYRITRLSGN